MSTVIDRLRASRKSVQLNRGKKKRPAGPRLWLWMMGIGALALALVLPLSIAFAVHDDDLFELNFKPIEDRIDEIVGVGTRLRFVC